MDKPSRRERTESQSANSPVPSVSAEITSIGGRRFGEQRHPPRRPREEDRRTLKGANLPNRTPMDSGSKLWESREDLAYDVVFRHSRAGVVIGTGQPRQAVSTRGRPRCSPTLITHRRWPAGHLAATATPKGRHFITRRPTPASCYRLVGGSRRQRAPTSRKPRDAGHGRQLGHHQLARYGRPPASRIEILDPLRQHRRAQRYLEPLVRHPTPTAEGLADHQPESSVPSMAGGAHRAAPRRSSPR